MKTAAKNGSANGISSCRCCGTCCKKGGPALHGADRPLIESGTILLRHLYTIRVGERVFDPIRGGILPLTSEVIKIKSGANSSICTFYDGHNRKCRVYAQRPIECQLLECWNTRAIEKMYERDRLTRKDILEDVNGLWELVADHEQRCGYRRLGDLISRLKKGQNKKLVAELGEMINYDSQLRQLVLEKCQIESEMRDFLFGRPLEINIEMFGVHLHRDAGKIKLTFAGLP